MASLARTRSASSSVRLMPAGGMCAQLLWATSCPPATTASHSLGQLSMVKPGTNQVLWMRRDARKARMRREASAPNSPRDSGVGVVMPRAMKPDCVSKSKVRQTMWRGMVPVPLAQDEALVSARGDLLAFLHVLGKAANVG